MTKARILVSDFSIDADRANQQRITNGTYGFQMNNVLHAQISIVFR